MVALAGRFRFWAMPPKAAPGPSRKARSPRLSAGMSGALGGVSTGESISGTIKDRDRWTRRKLELLRAFAATLSGTERDIVDGYLRRVEGRAA